MIFQGIISGNIRGIALEIFFKDFLGDLNRDSIRNYSRDLSENSATGFNMCTEFLQEIL